MTTLYTLLTLILWIYGFLMLFAIVMCFYGAKLRGELTLFLRLTGAVPLVIGYLVDVLTNWTLAILIFWDWPKELLVTERLERYAEQLKNDYRKKLAVWLCDELGRLDPRGQHCFPRN